ncbi:MAG: DUF4266 domain-containing protein [Myxococcales bacterium]|nr:DUF4266 domain-containing protein [Myxococcales bacterium]
MAIGTCWLSSCQTTHFYERRRLADGCMQFDANGRLAYIRSKIEAAREGSLGGFGAGTAGGCGCQ